MSSRRCRLPFFGVALNTLPNVYGSSWAGVRAFDLGLALVSVQIAFGGHGVWSSLTCLIVSSLTGAAPWLVIAVTALPMLTSRRCEMIVSASLAGFFVKGYRFSA